MKIILNDLLILSFHKLGLYLAILIAMPSFIHYDCMNLQPNWSYIHYLVGKVKLTTLFIGVQSLVRLLPLNWNLGIHWCIKAHWELLSKQTSLHNKWVFSDILESGSSEETTPNHMKWSTNPNHPSTQSGFLEARSLPVVITFECFGWLLIQGFWGFDTIEGVYPCSQSLYWLMTRWTAWPLNIKIKMETKLHNFHENEILLYIFPLRFISSYIHLFHHKKFGLSNKWKLWHMDTHIKSSTLLLDEP